MGKLLASQRFHLFHLVFHTAKLTDGVFFLFIFFYFYFNSEIQTNNDAALCVWSVVVCNFTMQNMEYVFKSDYYKIGPMARKMREGRAREGRWKKKERMPYTLFIRRIFYQFATPIKNIVITTKTNGFTWLAVALTQKMFYIQSLQKLLSNMGKCTGSRFNMNVNYYWNCKWTFFFLLLTIHLDDKLFDEREKKMKLNLVLGNHLKKISSNWVWKLKQAMEANHEPRSLSCWFNEKWWHLISSHWKLIWSQHNKWVLWHFFVSNVDCSKNVNGYIRFTSFVLLLFHNLFYFINL